MRPRLKIKEELPTPKSLRALRLQSNQGDMERAPRTDVKPIIGGRKPHNPANLVVLVLL